MAKRPVSTRATNPIGKVCFPGEASIGDEEAINDISGIVQDISNIEDTSFQITIDTFNNRVAGQEKRKLGQTCKLNFNFRRTNYYRLGAVTSAKFVNGAPSHQPGICLIPPINFCSVQPWCHKTRSRR